MAAETLLSLSSAWRAEVVDSRRLRHGRGVSGKIGHAKRGQLGLNSTYACCLGTARRPAARARGALALKSDGKDMTVVLLCLGEKASRMDCRDVKRTSLTLLFGDSESHKKNNSVPRSQGQSQGQTSTSSHGKSIPRQAASRHQVWVRCCEIGPEKVHFRMSCYPTVSTLAVIMTFLIGSRHSSAGPGGQLLQMRRQCIAILRSK